LCENILFVWMAGFLLLHARLGEELLFSPGRESFSLSESSRELSFASARVVAQTKAVSPK